MDKLQCLVFDVWGEFGHFRKYYTTASPLTYSIPPRTALCGMAAAIAGIDRDEYLKHFDADKAYISIELKNRVKKMRMGLNYIATEDNAASFARFKNHTPVTMEYLKQPCFRIYIHHKESDIYQKLKACLEEGKPYYTPCLGVSEHVAFIKYIGEYEVEMLEADSNEYVEINSVIPERNKKINIEFEDGEYMKEMMPNRMGENREPLEYIYAIFERTAQKPIKCTIGQYWRINTDDKFKNIVFL